MSEQKVWKYIAIVLGIILAVAIVGGVITGILVVVSIFTGVSLNWWGGSGDLIESRLVVTEYVTNIDIRSGVSTLEIRSGEQFEVILSSAEGNTTAEVRNDTLRIEDHTRRRNFVCQVRSEYNYIYSRRKNF